MWKNSLHLFALCSSFCRWNHHVCTKADVNARLCKSNHLFSCQRSDVWQSLTSDCTWQICIHQMHVQKVVCELRFCQLVCCRNSNENHAGLILGSSKLEPGSWVGLKLSWMENDFHCARPWLSSNSRATSRDIWWWGEEKGQTEWHRWRCCSGTPQESHLLNIQGVTIVHWGVFTLLALEHNPNDPTIHSLYRCQWHSS